MAFFAVFVLNGASGEDFDLSSYDVMQTTLAKVFEKSNLELTGSTRSTSLSVLYIYYMPFSWAVCVCSVNSKHSVLFKLHQQETRVYMRRL